MKTISVKQPWANMIARGMKTIETRTWCTNYRGELLIASSKRPKIYPAGAIVCMAELVDCRPMTREDASAACCPWHDGIYSWVLENVRQIYPIPISGALGIYEIDIEPSQFQFVNAPRSE
jgi:hypothetical protein